MRKLVLTLLTLLSLNTFAQWETHYYVDEFGDETNESYKALVAKGTFSNSATQNSLLLGGVIWDEKNEAFSIKLLEYGSSLATKIESTFITVKIKSPKGEVYTINRVFYSKAGSLYFSEKRYKKLMEALKDKGEYIMVFSYKSSYSISNYKLRFTLK